MSRRSRYVSVAIAIAIAFSAVLVSARAALSETVEVAPNVRVTKKAYPAPLNEQPFFGFADKNAEQRAADESLKSGVLQAVGGDRQKAFFEITLRAWRAVNTGKLNDAANRFNQALLFAPEESALYHGFAIIAQARFNDSDYAEELFKIALKQPNPLKSLKADYGRFLLIVKRPRDALPVLEQAVIDAPTFADAWSNLGFARFETGDSNGACVALQQALKQRPTADASKDIARLKDVTKCN